MLAGFLDWRSARHMGSDHAAKLKGAVGSALRSVRTDQPKVLYDNDPPTSDFMRGLVEAHFPEVAPLLSEWDTFDRQLNDAHAQTDKAIREAGIGRWASGNPFVPDGMWGVIRAASTWVAHNITPQSPPPPLPFEAWGGGTLGLRHGTASGGLLLAQGLDDAIARATADDLNRWTKSFLGGQQVAHWRSVLSRQARVREQVVTMLQPIVHAEYLSLRRCGKSCEAA